MNIEQTLNIAACEIARVDTTGTSIRVPVIDKEIGSAMVTTINLDGYIFPGLAITRTYTDDVELIVNLETGMVLELFPVVPDQIDESETAVALAKSELEKLVITKND